MDWRRLGVLMWASCCVAGAGRHPADGRLHMQLSPHHTELEGGGQAPAGRTARTRLPAHPSQADMLAPRCLRPCRACPQAAWIVALLLGGMWVEVVAVLHFWVWTIGIDGRDIEGLRNNSVTLAGT
jgi:hypothetical protein